MLVGHQRTASGARDAGGLFRHRTIRSSGRFRPNGTGSRIGLRDCATEVVGARAVVRPGHPCLDGVDSRLERGVGDVPLVRERRPRLVRTAAEPSERQPGTGLRQRLVQQRTAGPVLSPESVLSASYTFHIDDVLEITPDVQYVAQPSGMSAIDDVLIRGVRFALTLSSADPRPPVRPSGCRPGDGRVAGTASTSGRNATAARERTQRRWRPA